MSYTCQGTHLGIYLGVYIYIYIRRQNFPPKSHVTSNKAISKTTTASNIAQASWGSTTTGHWSPTTHHLS